MDPIVNRLLYQNGFDLSKYLRKGIRIQMPYVRENQIESMLHPYDRHWLKCLVIEKLLEWEIIKDENINNKFEEFYIEHYPNILREAREFIIYIKSIGTNTPGNAFTILNKLIIENHVDNFIKLE
jgi:hypothetical protein